MSRLEFNASPRQTLGVEVELALVDSKTMALRNANEQILHRLPPHLVEKIKPELMQSYVEVNSDICQDVAEVEADLRGKIADLEEICDDLGLRLYWSGTHPFSKWRDQEVTNNQRYHGLINLLQDTARQLITFGLHVHVGIDSGDKAVMICDRIMRHLPTLLAASCNSPFWEGRITGLSSWRSKVMDGLPTAGLPPLMRNWSEYVWLVNHMVDTGFINTIREIWWDVRPHHSFGTVEVRVCDMPGNLEDVLAITAFIQCLVKALSDEIDRGTYQHDCHPMMVRQNKWRASRFGNRAQMVNSYTYEVQSVSEIVRSLIDRLGPTADRLGCTTYLEQVQQIADGFSWSERQRQILEKTGDATEIVRQITTESRITSLDSTTKVE